MQKKRKKWIFLLVALVSAAAIGGTLAFMFKRAKTVNTFKPAVVSCSVYEKLDGVEVAGSSAVGSEKSDIRIQNTGNVPAYLRVRLVSYFVDADGNITGSDPSAYPAITLGSGWIAGEEHTYYYTAPIEPNSFTPELGQPFALSQKTAQDGKMLYQVIEVFAEACQSEPTSAAEKAWGVTVAGGKITAAP